MAKKKSSKSTPRYRRFNQSQRLQSAKHWLKRYRGKNTVRGYRKHFGVDWPTAFKELEMLGVPIDPQYKQLALKSAADLAAYRRKKRQKRRAHLDGYNGEACAEDLIPLLTDDDLFF